MELKERIYQNFISGKLCKMGAVQVTAALKLPAAMKKKVLSHLKELEKEGKLFKDGLSRYGTAEQLGVFCARVKGTPHGYAFLIPEGCAERENDYFVPRKKLNGALDGDTVAAIPLLNDEAAVVKIISRGRKVVTGRFETNGHAGFVLCDDGAFAIYITIPPTLFCGAVAGDKVLAEVTGYPKGNAPVGKILEVLGKDGDFLTEELALIKDAGVGGEFPEYVISTAEKVAAAEIKIGNRRDFTSLTTFTIDGEDTRDMDDAVSLEIKDGKYILGVHIADVAEYVKYKGCIDKEAYSRGTSVYFPDRVYPMLPKALSNGACSLNPDERRYAISCIMTFDENGKKESFELVESVIESKRKMTYTEVAAIIDGMASATPEIDASIRDMARLTELLIKAASGRGQVDLDVKEAHIYVDGDGKIVIPECERNAAHRLIEQFMIAANECVAKFLKSKKLPCLYRVHEPPAEEKAESLYAFIKDLGLRSRGTAALAKPEDYQYILKQTDGKPYRDVVANVMLRSMQKARYSEKNFGHFGLALKDYCHFTSPIRRYPDLFVHRVLKCALRGENLKADELYSPVAADAALHSSERERIAEKVERDVDDLYKLAYMQERIGEEFDACISGVIESGVFARLANTVEGMIRLESLPDDSYAYFPEKFLLKGRRHSYKLGDKVRIKVAGCDFGSRKIQFVLA